MYTFYKYLLQNDISTEYVLIKILETARNNTQHIIIWFVRKWKSKLDYKNYRAGKLYVLLHLPFPILLFFCYVKGVRLL